jgi:hypothetical protein
MSNPFGASRKTHPAGRVFPWARLPLGAFAAATPPAFFCGSRLANCLFFGKVQLVWGTKYKKQKHNGLGTPLAKRSL